MAHAAPASHSPIGTVLLVEDEPVERLAASEALMRAGAREVASCGTMREALAALEHLRPDVVVLDVRLADRSDGWALAELLPLFQPRAPQVIFATATPEAIPQGVAGLGTILAKPYVPEDLVALIRGRSGSLAERLRGVFSGDPA